MKEKDTQAQKGFTFIEGLLVVILVGIVGFAGWYIYDSNNKTNDIYDQTASVQNASNYGIKATNNTSSEKNKTTIVVSDSLKQNAADSIKSGNTTALEGYMADSVTVVFATSEKGGTETPVQAIKDLEFLKSATAPWDFTLSDATLETYRSGPYGKYFGKNTIVGKSANGMVVSFGVNSTGRIDTVFMAGNADSLTE